MTSTNLHRVAHN